MPNKIARTTATIDALEEHKKLIKASIDMRGGQTTKARSAVKAFVVNNHVELGVPDPRLRSVDWAQVVDYFMHDCNQMK